MAAWNMKLARERRHPLPRHHPLYRRKLELSTEHTAFALGHRSLLENCPLFLCLMLGVHSIVNPLFFGCFNKRATTARQTRLWPQNASAARVADHGFGRHSFDRAGVSFPAFPETAPWI